MDEPILLERDGRIATVVLNRPERKNACNLAMWRRLGEVMAGLHDDPELRCVVVRGAGGEAFGAGADISEFEEHRFSAEQARAYNEHVAKALHGLRDCPQPVVALVQGPCVGGGLELAMMCDLRIAGEGAKFGIPINRLGHVLATEELAELTTLVGRPGALELLLEGRLWSAREAYVRGLATRVVADDAVEAEAYKTAERIAAGAPYAARHHKALTRRLLEDAPLTDEERDIPFKSCDTADYQTGVRAFLNKEKPVFRDE